MISCWRQELKNLCVTVKHIDVHTEFRFHVCFLKFTFWWTAALCVFCSDRGNWNCSYITDKEPWGHVVIVFQQPATSDICNLWNCSEISSIELLGYTLFGGGAAAEIRLQVCGDAVFLADDTDCDQNNCRSRWMKCSWFVKFMLKRMIVYWFYYRPLHLWWVPRQNSLHCHSVLFKKQHADVFRQFNRVKLRNNVLLQ